MARCRRRTAVTYDVGGGGRNAGQHDAAHESLAVHIE
jgi:hypothetical protein